MQQYFIQEAITGTGLVRFEEDQVHHIQRVMRFHSGTKVLVVDGTHAKFIVELDIQAGYVAGRVVDTVSHSVELPCTVIVAQGMIKGERFDLFLQKAGELGAHRIIPLATRRTVVKITSDKEDKKRQRWQKIAIEAAEQACRNTYPVVDEVMTLRDLIQVQADHKLVAFEEENRNATGLKTVYQKLQPKQTLLFVAGCEGGFDAEEIAFLQANGFIVCGLGPRILRAETAVQYALSALSYEVELSL